jgi:hypothetical protein
VRDLTVDVGRGNPGAIAVDYLSNNLGAIRWVGVRATAESGLTGIAMCRKWPGPTLLAEVEVEGFGTGVVVGETEYGVTIHGLRMRGVRAVARSAACAPHLAQPPLGFEVRAEPAGTG